MNSKKMLSENLTEDQLGFKVLSGADEEGKNMKWQKSFDSKIITRGEDLCSRNAISNIEQDGNVITAIAKGNDN